MVSAFMPEKPPYVEFERRSVEQRTVTGEVQYVPKDFVIIMPVGGKDKVEKEVMDWFEVLKMEIKAQRRPQDHLTQYTGAYEMFKRGEEIPEDGTPLRNWPVIGKAEFNNLKLLRIRTVEDLANANEETMQRIGMGSRALKRAAQDWLAAKGGANLVSQLTASRATIQALEERIAKQEEELKELSRRVAIDKSYPRREAQDPETQLQAVREAAGGDANEHLDVLMDKITE
jgi:uncharacterized coiled-coil protein SlyX